MIESTGTSSSGAQSGATQGQNSAQQPETRSKPAPRTPDAETGAPSSSQPRGSGSVQTTNARAAGGGEDAIDRALQGGSQKPTGDSGSTRGARNERGQFQSSSGESIDQTGTQAEQVEELLNLEEYGAKKVKLVVNGREEVLTVQEALREVQKGKAANQKFEEAHRLNKQNQELFELSKSHPAEFLKRQGFTEEQIDNIAKQRLAQKIQWEMMSPEQQEAATTKQRLEQYEKAEAEQKAQMERAAEEKVKSERRTHWERTIIESFEKSGIQPSPYNLRQAATYIQASLKSGHQVNTAQIAEAVRSDQIAMLQHSFKGADAATILKYFPDCAKTIREHDIQQVENPNPQKFAQSPQVKPRGEARKPDKKMTWEEYSKLLDERVKG